MNITKITESSNRIIVDYDLPELPEEIKDLIRHPEYSFYVIGPVDENSVFDFSANQLYKKDENSIENTYYNGDLYFGDVFFLDGENDLNLIYKASFHKGVLEELSLFQKEFLNNNERKIAFEAFYKKVAKLNKLESNILYKYIYTPYKMTVSLVFYIVRKATLFLFKAIDSIFQLIQKILSPL